MLRHDITTFARDSGLSAHDGAKGSSLNDRGAGDRERRFNYASERSRSGTWSDHRHTESYKPNKTKLNKTSEMGECTDWFSKAGYLSLSLSLSPFYAGVCVCVLLLVAVGLRKVR